MESIILAVEIIFHALNTRLFVKPYKIFCHLVSNLALFIKQEPQFA